MKRTVCGPRFLTVALSALSFLGLAALPGLADAMDAPEPDRLTREIRIMERVIDEVLVQSPNVLVSPAGATRGLVVDGFGALFVLDASLGDSRFGLLGSGAFLGPEAARAYAEDARARAEQARARAEQAFRKAESAEEKRKELEEKAGGEAPDEASRSDWAESLTEWQKQSEQSRKKHLKAFEDELVETLLDYGPTLGGLGDNDWVALAAFLDGESRLLAQGGGERVIVKIKMRDLRQYAAGKLSRDEARSRISIETQ